MAVSSSGAGVVVSLADLGYQPTKQGKILSKGGSGAWDEAMVEGPQVFWDPATRLWWMAYVGYSGVFTAGFPPAGSLGKVGLASNPDISNPNGWTKYAGNPVFQGTGNIGTDWDGGTITAPSIYVENGVYHLFYAGTSQAGWEASGGVPLKTGLATATSVTGPYARAAGNPIIAGTSGWRGKNIFHRSIVKKGSTYYLFFNASTSGDVESIGYATASSLTGAWTVDDVNSPVLQGAGGSVWDANYAADPSVFRDGNNNWWMAYAGNKTGAFTSDGIAGASDSTFPLGWKRHPSNPLLVPDQAYDNHLCGKPCYVRHGSKLYHFHTVKAGDDSDVSIGLAINSIAA